MKRLLISALLLVSSKTQSLDIKYSVDGGPVWPIFPTVLER